jgi:hypothetical protein
MNRAQPLSRRSHFTLPLLLLLASASCKGQTPPVHSDAVFTVEEGRVVRMPAYRGEYPVLGQCVRTKDYALSRASCAEIGTPQAPQLRILEKQGYSSSSRLLSVHTGVAANVAGQKAKAEISVTKYRMFIEWNRYTVFSLDKEKTESGTGPYVSAVEYGVGVRIILDISLTKVGTEADAKFGLGTIAAHLDAGQATVAVKYDTIGVPFDILPKGLPTTIESVNDISRMIEGLNKAVEKVSDSWNEVVKRAPGAKVGAILTSDGRYATVLHKDEPLPEAKIEELQPVIAAAKHIQSDRANIQKTMDRQLPLLDALSGVTGTTAGQDIGPVLDDLEALRELSEQSTNESLSSALPSRTEIDRAINVLREYYPYEPSWNGTLFPSDFSAAPLAYYVARPDRWVARDRCVQANLDARSSGTRGKTEECEEPESPLPPAEN